MNRRILVIDDDATMTELIKRELEQLGYSVVTDTSPQRALQTLLSEDFGIILTDINMRGMSGVELCERVAQLREETPVIVMTASPDDRIGGRFDPRGRVRLRDQAV